MGLSLKTCWFFFFACLMMAADWRMKIDVQEFLLSNIDLEHFYANLIANFKFFFASLSWHPKPYYGYSPSALMLIVEEEKLFSLVIEIMACFTYTQELNMFPHALWHLFAHINNFLLSIMFYRTTTNMSAKFNVFCVIILAFFFRFIYSIITL